jgi:hypothetical protein
MYSLFFYIRFILIKNPQIIEEHGLQAVHNHFFDSMWRSLFSPSLRTISFDFIKADPYQYTHNLHRSQQNGVLAHLNRHLLQEEMIRYWFNFEQTSRRLVSLNVGNLSSHYSLLSRWNENNTLFVPWRTSCGFYGISKPKLFKEDRKLWRLLRTNKTSWRSLPFQWLKKQSYTTITEGLNQSLVIASRVKP